MSARRATDDSTELAKNVVKYPRQEVYGIKKQLFIAKFVAHKLKAVAHYADRRQSAIFSFCFKHALALGAFKTIPQSYRVRGDTDAIGVRFPGQWLTDLRDLAWEKDSDIASVVSYLCSYSLSTKAVHDWVAFFKSGTDIIHDFLFYIHTDVCDTQTKIAADSLKMLETSLNKKILLDSRYSLQKSPSVIKTPL